MARTSPQLAKDYSEGPGAANGGVVPRVLQASDLGPELLSRLGTLPVNGISDPVQDQARFMIFKLLERPAMPGSPNAGFRVAQIMIRVKPDDNSLRDQMTDLSKLRSRASAIGLGAAAAEKGLVTTKTAFYDYNNPPTQLYGAPEAAEWGLEAKLHKVSPVFDGLDEFVLAQVTARHEGGPASREEIPEQLRQLAEMEARLTAARPRADSVAMALQHGRSLEAAAKEMGLEHDRGHRAHALGARSAPGRRARGRGRDVRRAARPRDRTDPGAQRLVLRPRGPRASGRPGRARHAADAAVE